MKIASERKVFTAAAIYSTDEGNRFVLLKHKLKKTVETIVIKEEHGEQAEKVPKLAESESIFQIGNLHQAA